MMSSGPSGAPCGITAAWQNFTFDFYSLMLASEPQVVQQFPGAEGVGGGTVEPNLHVNPRTI